MISADSITPLYEQVANDICGKIEKGELRPGDRIGSITALMHTYNVSRVTAVNALDNLVRRGIAVSRQGKGTFVRSHSSGEELSVLKSFHELTRGNEETTRQVILACEPSFYPDDVSEAIKDDEKGCFYIERLTYIDNETVCLVKMWLPLKYSDIFFGKAEVLEKLSVFEMFEQNGIRVNKSNQIISAAAADKETAHLLSIKKGAPILKVNRTTYSDLGVPLMYSIFYYRGDSYSFKINLNRNPEK